MDSSTLKADDAATMARSLLCTRLAGSQDLLLPARLLISTNGKPSRECRWEYLHSLLEQDPSVFLERHGKDLSTEEISIFEPLSHDYEVAFWLQRLQQQKHPAGSVIKNR